MSRRRGFTLLEVLVALAILSLAVVTVIQLFGQGLRLLKVSGDYQQAVLLADQKAREVETVREGTEAGQEGNFEWERRATVMPVPEELNVVGARPVRLFRVTVQVRWGTRSVEVATLRTAREPLPQ
ncbi:MAG: prepilin-type N-terminal cleavage/methylation domain-containing protein [Candidatus Rokubacteria bacterium]|nr:prepilin-type N-terminal cleavage/methylation domain-containing protein [Candidatus Rokubacteria bacterium]MBI2553429.1 prepilin-type N-terminal cleavage/methylation domain-containing protein [Candidatus Rokubacteria bacterium]